MTQKLLKRNPESFRSERFYLVSEREVGLCIKQDLVPFIVDSQILNPVYLLLSITSRVSNIML